MLSGIRCAASLSFNPRAPREESAAERISKLIQEAWVSIHAPPVRRARQLSAWSAVPQVLFQSTRPP